MATIYIILIAVLTLISIFLYSKLKYEEDKAEVIKKQEKVIEKLNIQTQELLTQREELYAIVRSLQEKNRNLKFNFKDGTPVKSTVSIKNTPEGTKFYTRGKRSGVYQNIEVFMAL